MTTTLEAARELISRGWAPVPIAYGTKKPADEGWPKLRITAEDAANHFNGRPQNIGVILGDASGGLVDVDLDAMEAVELADQFLPETGAMFGREGKPQSHWLYRVPGLKTLKFQVGSETIVELRSTGCQTVVPPSVHLSGESVTWYAEGEPAQVSADELVRAVRKVALAALLVRHFPEHGRNDTALAIAGMLLRAKWSDEEVEHFIEVVADEGGSRDVPAKVKTVADTRAKLDAGEEVTGLPKLKELIGDDVGKVIGKWLGAKAPRKHGLGEALPEADTAVDKLNMDYAVVQVADKVRILQEWGPLEFTLLPRSEFRALFSNRFCEVMGGKTECIADVWDRSPRRRQYSRIVFEPGERQTRGAYNLFRGWAVQQRPGDCSMLLEHIRENICKGDEALYLWVMGWFAQLVQHPARKLGTSLVFRGKRGTGKTIVGKSVGRLLGPHYFAASQARHITGQFNAHLERCLLLHAEEAFWAGDKQAEAVLKDLITSDKMLLERKGIDPIQIANHLRLLVSSNSQWVVPAGQEERRFAVLDVGEGKMQDHTYFGAMEDQLERGGYEALLHELLTFDCSQVNLRAIPATAALQEQKINSLTGEQKWWLDILMAGELPGDIKGEGECSIGCLHHDYMTKVQRIGYSRRASETEFGMLLRKMVPGITRKRRQARNGARFYVYKFPPLNECRAAFDADMRSVHDWDDDATDWQKAPASGDQPGGLF